LKLLDEAFAKGTTRNHRTYWNKWIAFVRDSGMNCEVSMDRDTVELALEYFVTWLVRKDRSLTGASFAKYCGHMARVFREARDGEPDIARLGKGPALTKLLRAAARLEPTVGLQARPVEVEELEVLIRELEKLLEAGFRRAALKFLWLAAFWGGYRLGDLVPGADARETQGQLASVTTWRSGTDGTIHITVRFTKTQRDARGRTTRVSGDNDENMGILSVARAWRELEDEARCSGKRAADWWKEWKFRDVVDMLKSISSKWGESERPGVRATLTGHSFRRGLVIAALEAGLTPGEIKSQTGHRSEGGLQPYTNGAVVKFRLAPLLQKQGRVPGRLASEPREDDGNESEEGEGREEEGEYVVEAIRGLGVIDGEEFCEVKWEGWTRTTWEPVSNLVEVGVYQRFREEWEAQQKEKEQTKERIDEARGTRRKARETRRGGGPK
jgi:hypothetical protein